MMDIYEIIKYDKNLINIFIILTPTTRNLTTLLPEHVNAVPMEQQHRKHKNISASIDFSCHVAASISGFLVRFQVSSK